MTCLWFELLNRVIPVAGLRLRLCGWHVNRCPRCLPASAGDEALATILVTAEQLSPTLDLWAGIRKGIDGLQVPASALEVARLPLRQPRRWAYAAAMTAVLVIAGLKILFLGRPPGPQPDTMIARPTAQTRLSSASIENRPARVFLFQSRNPDRTIFWIAKDDKRS
jgi:hypothetical protein